MYGDNASGELMFCADGSIAKSTDGSANGPYVGYGYWQNVQTATPVNYYDVANKGYVDAAGGGGKCYTSYSGTCDTTDGFNNVTPNGIGTAYYCYSLSFYFINGTGHTTYIPSFIAPETPFGNLKKYCFDNPINCNCVPITAYVCCH